MTLCKDSRKLLMNVAARGMGRTLCYISAECIVQQVSILNNSIQTVDRCRCWIRRKRIERTKCNGAFSSSQSGSSCRSWAQPHWPGWMKGKGGKRDHKKGREQEIGSVSFIQHYNLGRWIAFVALRGSLFIFFHYAIYTHNLTIRRGASRGDLTPAVSAPWPLMYLTESQF